MQSKTIFGDPKKINNYTALAKETEVSFFSNTSELISDKTEKKINTIELIGEKEKKIINITNETELIGKKKKINNINNVNNNFNDVNKQKDNINVVNKRNYLCNTCAYYRNLNKEIIKSYQKKINYYTKLANDYEKELLFYKRVFTPKNNNCLQMQKVISREFCKYKKNNELEIQNVCSFTLNEEEEEYNDDDSLITVSTMVGRRKYKKHITRKEYYKILDEEGFDIH